MGPHLLGASLSPQFLVRQATSPLGGHGGVCDNLGQYLLGSGCFHCGNFQSPYEEVRARALPVLRQGTVWELQVSLRLLSELWLRGLGGAVLYFLFGACLWCTGVDVARSSG